jgi:hypothetical protein
MKLLATPGHAARVPSMRRRAEAHGRHVDVASPTAERRFVATTLGTCFACLLAVIAFNVVVDPFAIAGTRVVPPAVETDRAIKLSLIDRLTISPDILVLGSSRSRQAEPAYLRLLTGHGGYNAGVTGGTAADAYVFARYTASRFRGARRRYILFVDAGVAVAGVNPQLAADPRVAPYLRGGSRFRLSDLGTYVGLDASRASLRVLDKCVLHSCSRDTLIFNPDGSLPHAPISYSPATLNALQQDAATIVAGIRKNPPKPHRFDPRRYVYFEQFLAFANSRGERPVIVFNPIYPTVLAELERHGFPDRAASLAHLKALHHRYDFVVVNCQDIRTWGGKAEDFNNATHVNWRNMRRMLRYVTAHSGAALR